MMYLGISKAEGPRPASCLTVTPDCSLPALSVEMRYANFSLPVGTSIQNQFTLVISQTTRKGKKQN